MDRQIAGPEKVPEMPVIQMEYGSSQNDVRQMRAHVGDEQGPRTGERQIMPVMQIIEMERCGAHCSVMNVPFRKDQDGAASAVHAPYLT